MHYVRFLKQPTLRPSPTSHKSGRGGVGLPASSSATVHALITLETDLGDSIYYGTVTLRCSVLCDSDAVKTDTSTQLKRGASTGKEAGLTGNASAVATRSEQVVGSIDVAWSSGLRSLAVEVPLSAAVKGVAATAKMLRLRVAATGEQRGETTALQGGCLVMPVIIPQIAAIVGKDGADVDGRAQVERPLVLGDGRELMIWEDAGISMARHVWDAGVALVALLDEVVHRNYNGLPHVASLLSSSVHERRALRVLELGAGCGLAGVAFSTLVPDVKVVITDVPDAERLVLRNIAANRPANNTTAEFQVLDWSGKLPEEVASQKLDIVLVADCIYNEDSIPDLVKTLSSLAEISPSVVVIVATKTRHSSEQLFFDLVEKAHFKIVARTHVLAPGGDTSEDVQDAERIDMYELMFGPV